jgi:hypothetical protein
MNNDIDNYFSDSPSSFYDTFTCPSCNKIWGISKYGDPPSNMDEIIKCTCDYEFRVVGEWISNYDIEVKDDNN